MTRNVIAMASQGDYLVVVLDNGEVYQRREASGQWIRGEPIPETAAHPQTTNARQKSDAAVPGSA